jgi:uncharacterized membrane protein YhaH (DUF805 family)
MAGAVRTCFAKYFTFSGRARRSEYWWFFLFVFLTSFVLGFVDALAFGREREGTSVAFLAPAWQLATLLPSTAVGWRRMHDTGRSGLYLFYPFLVMLGIGMFAGLMVSSGAVHPGGAATGALGTLGLVVLAFAALVFLISPLIVLWWLTRPSQPGSSLYGPNPHEVST